MSKSSREAIMTTGARVILATAPAIITSDLKVSVATAICEVLTVAMDSFRGISGKRTEELFSDAETVDKVISKINKSEDFASLTLDLWMRYNFESSEKRRGMLKSILERASREEDIDYENFSKLFLITQQITNHELLVLDAFYMPEAYKYADNPTNAMDFHLNVHELYRLFEDKKLNDAVKPEIEQSMSQLSSYGLISEHPATIGGPYYSPLRFGRIFMEYIKS